MIIAVVQISQEILERELATILDQELETAKAYQDHKGSCHKHCINGGSGDGDINVFDTRDNADAWYHDGWASWMEGRFGTRPKLNIYDKPLILINDAEEVHANGEAMTPPWLTDAAK